MKRKYFSVMLMAAMTVASTSMVTSCKDYDDDINGLRTEITNNATTLTALVNEKVNNLTTELNTLKSQQTTLEQALKDAQSSLDAAIKKAETDSKAYADVQAAAAQKAAIEAAQKNLDDAVKTINASIDAANKRVDEVNSKVSTNAEAIAKLLDADKELQNAINVVKADAEAAAQKALDAANAAQKTADENANKLAQVSDNLTKVQSDLEKSISVLGEKVDANVEAIAKNKAEADSKFEEVTSLIEANQKAIAALKDADADLLTKIEANQKKLGELAEELAAAKTACEANLQTAKDYTDTQVAALKKELGADIETVKTDAAKALADAVANQKLINEALENADKDLAGKIEENADNLTQAIASTAEQLNNLKTELSKDIDANKVAISDLQKLATGLQDQISTNKADIDAVKKDLENYVKKADFTKEVGDLNDAITDLQNKIKDITGDAGYVKSLQSQIDALQKALDDTKNTKANLSDFKTLNDAFGKLTAGYNGTLAELSTAVTKNATAISENLKTLQDQIDVLAGFAKQLKSLVFGPTEYYQGIEAIGVFSFNYNAIQDLPAYNAEKDQVDANTNYTTARNETTVAPYAEATYYLNPSNANIDTDVKNFKFIVTNASYTRAQLNATDLDIKKVEAADGKVKVTFNVNNAKNIAAIPTTGDGKVDVAALQYKYKSANNDTIVTSDWAALKKYNVTDFIINKAKAAGKTEEDNELHLATTASAAVANDGQGNYSAPTLEIVYDDAKGINLDEWMNVHYNNNGNADKLWGGQATVNKKGFKLVYSLVGYKSGANKTNESAHATINGNILTVNGYKEETGRQIIGRTPLVRVTLVDENTNNQVASVGYIVVKITDKEVKPVEVTADAITNKFTVACNPSNSLKNVQAITWEEIENKVCSQLDITKTEFETNWTFDATNQYVKNNNGKFEVAATNFGSVVKTTSDDPSHETNVLEWTVDNATAYDYFVTKKNTTKSIWVKFAPNSTVATVAPIYVELTWTPAAINKAPEATIKNSADHKKEAAWHAENANTPGWSQLHIQVGNATQPNATCEYQNLVIANTFNKDVLDIVKSDIKATYPELANAASVSFKFAPLAEQTHKSYVGVSGTTYNVTVKDDGSEIYANRTLIATITATNGTVNIEKNDVSKDILNKYNNLADLANALTMTVKAEVTTCAPAENLIKLNNNKFDVKVIKPLFVGNATIDGMQLNNYSTLTQQVSFDFKDFNGYTQAQFYANSNRQKKFFDFYKISAIKQVGTIMTDYSGAKKAIDTNDIKVTFTQSNLKDMSYYTSGVVKNMGTVKLEQVNQSRANGFTVWVPVEITYNWGTLKTEIVLNVKAASAAAAKRH